MDHSRLVSLLVFTLVVGAAAVAAPSIEDPTRTHSGRIYFGSNDTSPQSGDFQRDPVEISNRNNSSSSDGSGAQADENEGLLPLFTAVVGAVLVALVVGSALVFYRAAGERIDPDRFVVSADETPQTEDTESDADLGAVGAAAGRAAEHIAEDPQNAVYRAWCEMTAPLDLPTPEASTPGEFADEATSAGMNPEDVAILTSLFEEVRYSDAPVTAERRRRARDALRRIESRYGSDEP